MDLNELVGRCIRIIYISRKPTSAEYEKVARVAAIGIIVIGVIGIIISIVFSIK
jgi:protein translocase SEC61 complex gamma subunit